MPTESPNVTLQIGETCVRLQSSHASFRQLLKSRYAGFVNPSSVPDYYFDVEISPARPVVRDDLLVSEDSGMWTVERGDFRATWNARTHRGWIRQSANPYSVDTLLRIVHSIVLAREGGFLLHAASAVRNGRAFIFSGVSGAGKTTLSRMAPPDVKTLTDEISYVSKKQSGYLAFGTPFAGELARVGENISAPVGALYFLQQGPENKLEEIEPATAVRALLRNILFLSQDAALVRQLFETALEFISSVPVRRMIFTRDPRAWELVQ